jgi:hypothetical protein
VTLPSSSKRIQELGEGRNINKTKIAYSKTLNKGKYDALMQQCEILGTIRSEIWNKFGSINAIGINPYDIQKQWVSEKKFEDLPITATAWKKVLSDTLANIKANYESAKEKIRKDIYQRTKDKEEQKQLYKLLRYNKWQDNPYLRRKIRQYWKRGHNHTYNQLIIRSDLFRQEEKNGTLWISIPSLVKGKPIWIPLTQSNPLPVKIKGDDTTKGSNLRLILKDGIVEIHYCVEVQKIENGCGTKTLGIDKGYSETFVDSEGNYYGKDLGAVLKKQSDFMKKKNAHRSRLRAIAEKKPEKAHTITLNNLGRKAINNRKKRNQSKIKTIVFTATHQLFKQAKLVIAEDLTSKMSGRKFSKDTNRRLSHWTKGVIAESLNSISMLRCSELHLINPAYTSQMDSRFGILLGDRKGDKFHCFDGVVLQADENASKNVLARYKDPDINLYTPTKSVKIILKERTDRFKVEHLSNQGFNGLSKDNQISTK